MFVNFSNHPSSKWSKEQLNTAAKSTDDGQIVDVSFPAVSPKWTKDEVLKKAIESVAEIMSHEPDAVMCQGEFTLAYNVVSLLKEKGVKVVAACSERMVSERDGKKVVEFKFEQFREY